MHWDSGLKLNGGCISKQIANGEMAQYKPDLKTGSYENVSITRLTKLLFSKKGRFSMKAYQKLLGMMTVASIATLFAQSASAVAINEFRVDHAGADTDEFFELAGTPGESLDGLTYIVIGDVPGGGDFTTGAIEVAISLDGLSIPADGYFLAVEDIFAGPAGVNADLVVDLNFENSDTVSHLLVSGFTGLDGDLIDSDQDGVLDSVLPWSSIIDGLSLEELVNTTEINYGPQLGIPTLSAQPSTGENYMHAYRDVDITGAWIGGSDYLFLDTETPGSPNVPADIPGDINGDGFVGLDDLDVVLNHWNQGTPPSGGNPSIPEPASLALLGVSLAACLRRRGA